MHTTTLLAAIGVATLAQAQRLTKPTLQNSLDYLQDGLMKNLHPVHSTNTQWANGWIPQDCSDMTKGAGLNPSDVSTYEVKYDDVSEV